jgi:hypothetical protein
VKSLENRIAVAGILSFLVSATALAGKVECRGNAGSVVIVPSGDYHRALIQTAAGAHLEIQTLNLKQSSSDKRVSVAYNSQTGILLTTKYFREVSISPVDETVREGYEVTPPFGYGIEPLFFLPSECTAL